MYDRTYTQLSKEIEYCLLQDGISILNKRTGNRVMLPWSDFEALVRKPTVWAEVYITSMVKDTASDRTWMRYLAKTEEEK